MLRSSLRCARLRETVTPTTFQQRQVRCAPLYPYTVADVEKLAGCCVGRRCPLFCGSLRPRIVSARRKGNKSSNSALILLPALLSGSPTNYRPGSLYLREMPCRFAVCCSADKQPGIFPRIQEASSQLRALVATVAQAWHRFFTTCLTSWCVVQQIQHDLHNNPYKSH